MKNRTLQKPVNWFASQIIQLVSTQYEFLLKGVSKPIIILTVCYYYVTHEFQSESSLYSLPECHGFSCLKQAQYLKFKWQQRDSYPQPLSS